MKRCVWIMDEFTKENKQFIRQITGKYKISCAACQDLKDMVRNLHDGMLPELLLFRDRQEIGKADRTNRVLAFSDPDAKQILTVFCRMYAQWSVHV